MTCLRVDQVEVKMIRMACHACGSRETVLPDFAPAWMQSHYEPEAQEALVSILGAALCWVDVEFKAKG